MGALVFILVLTVMALAYALWRQREQSQDELSEYAFRALDDQENLDAALRDLREAEARAMSKLRGQ